MSDAAARMACMIANVTNIIIAAAAVIGLVPVGLRALRDLLRNKQKKHTNEWLGTIGISVLLSLVAPSVLETMGRHIQAAGNALPDWVKAAVPPPPDGAAVPSNGQVPQPGGAQPPRQP